MLRSKLILAAAIALGTVAVGCADDDDDNKQATGGTGGSSGGPQGEGGMDENETSATISGTVTYEGDKTGPLVVSIHSSFPPSMTNVMGFAQVAEPTFPAEYTIDMVTPGTYFAVAYISVGMFHPGAGPGDPQGAYVDDAMMPTPIDVPAEGATGIDIALMDTN